MYSNKSLVAALDSETSCMRNFLVSLYMSENCVSVCVSSAANVRDMEACKESPNAISASEPSVICSRRYYSQVRALYKVLSPSPSSPRVDRSIAGWSGMIMDTQSYYRWMHKNKSDCYIRKSKSNYHPQHQSCLADWTNTYPISNSLTWLSFSRRVNNAPEFQSGVFFDLSSKKTPWPSGHGPH